MGKARPITAAGRKRVADALATRGLLLVQGQDAIPSVADLLANRPITTRGYSWDYVPAWNLTDEYEHDRDVALVKLFRGKRTLVHRRLWPAVHALAVAAREHTDDAMVVTVEAHPGIPLGELRTQLGIERRAFDRSKRTLESWLCIYGRERDDVDFHTHEPAIFPWSYGKIARSRPRKITTDDAIAALGESRLFPVARAIR